MAVGVKRIALLAIVLAAMAAIAVAVASFAINSEAIRASVEEDIRDATGLDFVIRGRVETSLFPAGTIVFHDVRLRSDGDGTPALVVDELRADLRVLPLLFHDYRLASVTLNRARVVVIREADRSTNWSPILRQLAKALQPGAARRSDLSEIRLTQSTLLLRDPTLALSETFEAVDMSLAWPSLSKSFAATGQLTFRDRRVDMSFSVGDFIAAMGGAKSSAKLRIAGAGFKAAFDGTLAQSPDFLADGVFAADAASLRDVARWLGRDVPGDGGFGRFALKAKASAAGFAVSLSDVNLELDGNVAEGVLSYSAERRRSLQGTLAAERLDLTPYLAGLRRARSQSEWSRDPITSQALSRLDIDLRVSAAQVTMGGTKAGRTALAVNLSGGDLTLSIAEAQMFGGMLKGSASLASSDGRARAQFTFSDVDLLECTGDLLGMRKLSGRGTLALALNGNGLSTFDIANSLGGTAVLTGHDGAVAGIDIEALLRRLERRPLSAAGRIRTGQTPFKTLNVALKFDGGIAQAEDVTMSSDTVRLRVAGSAAVHAREFDLKGTASLIGSDPKADALFELPFIVQGPWDDPLILPVPDALIRRSPASAPLLDAIRERKTGDAVRSAIERITGNRRVPEPQPAGPSDSAAPATAPPPEMAAPPSAEEPSATP